MFKLIHPFNSRMNIWQYRLADNVQPLVAKILAQLVEFGGKQHFSSKNWLRIWKATYMKLQRSWKIYKYRCWERGHGGGSPINKSEVFLEQAQMENISPESCKSGTYVCSHYVYFLHTN